MADKPSRFLPLKDEQARASRPNAHVVVRASAGTGKTHVLSARVLRLLLSGVSPERILCLTFTKAGAAEMAERVHSRLARWVQVDEGELFHDLEALGEDSGPDARDKARLLFARVLDATGGGLRILTIHSFCQSLLAAFPLEAGLVPGFRLLDDRAQKALSRQSLVEVIETAERGHDKVPLAAIEALALRLGEQGTIDYLARCVSIGPFLRPLSGDLEEMLLEQLDLPTGDLDAYIAGHTADAHLPEVALRRVATANANWGAPSAQTIVALVGQWLAAAPEGRVALIPDLLACLLTKTGEVKNRDKAKLLAADPGYVAVAADIGGRLKALVDLPVQVAYARLAAQGLAAGCAYAETYARAKRQAGYVDYDDLIGKTSALLRTEGIAEWIRFKLDQRIDHILVDEAQDTNDAQWDIVDAVIDDYFETEPDDLRGALRTLFVVGDTKQAIFGFQGTSPQAFVDALHRFRARAERTGHVIDDLPLALSFRSMPAVLGLVDAAIAEIGHEDIGLDLPPADHAAARRHPGRVLLLPPTVAGHSEVGSDEESDEEPAGDEDWLADHQRRHAERIAAQVKAWIDEGLWLHSKGRPIGPGDVLILLRSRSALSRLIVARLYEAGVPVAGVDRLRLQAPLAVRDLLAALRFAVQPEDDLNLANLLVSPLVGWSQDELMQRAIRPKGLSLWSHLRATCDEALLAPMRGLLAAADFTTPYRYLEVILSGPMDGRRKLVARLGEEARDAIEELLNAALNLEVDDHPSLQRFIDWFDRGEGDLKRELGEGGNMVRVMTVHGAKGLEAPLVILADAAFDPEIQRRAAALDLPVAGYDLPLISPKGAELCAPLTDARERSRRAELQEHWRLLYVALTRAEELLVVAGALGVRAKGEVPTSSWHALVGRAMARLGASEIAMEGWGSGLEWCGPQGLADAEATQRPDAAPAGAEPLPAWLHTPAPAEARPPRPLAPSASVEDDVPNPPPNAAMRAAAERGRLLHALFERLPAVAPSERRDAADRWLAGAGGLADPSARGVLVDHVLAVIEHPAHAGLFAPDALAEAPIAAVVGEQVIAGTVDRLLVTPDEIAVVDFKTGRAVPRDASAVPQSHVRQMAAYVAALGIIFPGRAVRASLLYTAGPQLIDLPEALMEAHKPGFPAPQLLL